MTDRKKRFVAIARKHWAVIGLACLLTFAETSAAKCDQSIKKFDIAIASIDDDGPTVTKSCWTDDRPCDAVLRFQKDHADKEINITIHLTTGNAYIKFVAAHPLPGRARLAGLEIA